MNLIIVESPTKAKTFSKYLDNKKFQVIASFGHLRDLPENKLGIEIDNRFKPQYQLSKSKQGYFNLIKNAAKNATQITLATDSDREGEAIAYHTAYLLGFIKENWPSYTITENVKLQRITFFEITKEAILRALNQPQNININLVDAQQARRILDRLVGYKLSPLLWKKIGKKWLSAGRVQTIALRLIVEREKEIKNWQSQKYYKIYADFQNIHQINIDATMLISKDDQPFEIKQKIKLFDGDYTFSSSKINSDNLDSILPSIKSNQFTVKSVDKKESVKNPPPAYTTSTLQQDCSRIHGFSAKTTMRLAQNLYEKGFITYHRTDSVTISADFVNKARQYITNTYTDKYLCETARFYKTKNKLAQEAHEAIRPTDLNKKLIIKEGINSLHLKLYTLIFNRAVATQMKSAIYDNLTIQILSSNNYLFVKKYEALIFNGYLVLYDKQPVDQLATDFSVGDQLNLLNLNQEENQTKPPARYSEASLIKSLEEKGIGRPSTYAPIISTILDKNYVERIEGRFQPNALGTAISDYLSTAFPDLFTIDYTARMEDKLDEIASGNNEMLATIDQFYQPLSKELEQQADIKTHINVQEETNEICPQCGAKLLIRYSKYGKFFGCSSYPKCKYIKSYSEKIDKKCPKCGGDIVVRFTKRRKRFYGCSNYPKCDFASWKLVSII